MKTLKVLAITLLAAFSFTVVNAQKMKKKPHYVRHHRIVKHHVIAKPHVEAKAHVEAKPHKK